MPLVRVIKNHVANGKIRRVGEEYMATDSQAADRSRVRLVEMVNRPDGVPSGIVAKVEYGMYAPRQFNIAPVDLVGDETEVSQPAKSANVYRRSGSWWFFDDGSKVLGKKAAADYLGITLEELERGIMSLISPNETAAFLGIDSSYPGLVAAVAQAESLVAGKLRIAKLELGQYTESRWILGDLQVFMPKHGPIQVIDEFELDGLAITDDVMIYSNRWGVVWNEKPPVGGTRAKVFKSGSLVTLTYAAGWTASDGLYPVPDQVAAYVMSLAGLTLDNTLGSGVYDTKLGDMTVKIQRETLEENLAVYDGALRLHARPVWG